MSKRTRLSQAVHFFTSRKHFRGVRDCPVSLAQICQGNVSKKLFNLKRSVRDDKFVSILSKIQTVSKLQYNELSEEWIKLALDQSLFGMQMDSKYQGLNLDNLQTACIFEQLCHNIPLALMLIVHKCWVLEPLISCNYHDESVLRNLTTGNVIGTLACSEKLSGIDFQAQIAKFDDTFSGEKCWIANGNRAKVFLVSGQDIDNNMRLALVDKTDAVKHKPMNIIGSDLTFCDVTFDKSLFSFLECDNSYSLLVSSMLRGRRHITELCSGLAKSILNEIFSFLRQDSSIILQRSSKDHRRICESATAMTFTCESLAFFVNEIHWDSDGIEVALASCRAINICRSLISILGELLDSRICLLQKSVLSTLKTQVELLSHFGWSELVVRLYAGSEMIRQLAQAEDSFRSLLDEKKSASQRIYLISERDCLRRGQSVFLYDLWEHSKCSWVYSHQTETSLVQLKSACYHLLLRDGIGVIDDTRENQQPDLIRIGQLGERVLTLLALQSRMHFCEKQRTHFVSKEIAITAFNMELSTASKIYIEICNPEYPQSEIASRIGRKLLREGRYNISFPVQRLF